MSIYSGNAMPELWSRRQAIILVDPNDVDSLSGSDLFFNREISVITLPLDRKNRLARHIIGSGLDRRGVMLMQNPFNPERYVETSQAPQKFALEKYLILTMLCGHLGAKKVTIEEVEKRTRSRTQLHKLAAKASITSGKLTTQQEELDEVLRKLEVEHEFPGAEPNFAEAEALLQRTRLGNDVEMHSLIEMRRGITNPVQRRRTVIDLSDETKRIFDLVGKIKIPQYLTEIEGGYNRIVREKAEYALAILVEF